jgi:glutaredoxin
MKRIFLLLLAFTAFGSAFAQQQPITVYEKKEGNKNFIMARNTAKVAYQVTVVIESTGMDVLPGKQIEAVVPAGHIVEIATLQPKPGEAWSYGYEVSFMETPAATPGVTVIDGDGTTGPTTDTESRNKPATPKLSDARIILYSKPGCGRCTAVKKQMDDRKISYEIVDVNSTSPEVNNMWKQLRDNGFTGDSVTMPVVRVDGKYHYNIKDLTKFVSEL